MPGRLHAFFLRCSKENCRIASRIKSAASPAHAWWSISRQTVSRNYQCCADWKTMVKYDLEEIASAKKSTENAWSLSRPLSCLQNAKHSLHTCWGKEEPKFKYTCFIIFSSLSYFFPISQSSHKIHYKIQRHDCAQFSTTRNLFPVSTVCKQLVARKIAETNKFATKVKKGWMICKPTIQFVHPFHLQSSPIGPIRKKLVFFQDENFAWLKEVLRKI